MTRILATLLFLLLVAAGLALAGAARDAAAAGPAGQTITAGPAGQTITAGPAGQTTAQLERIPRIQRGFVVTWRDGRLERVPFAHIGTGEDTVQADEFGRFTVPATIRTNQVNIVAPGYHVIRKVTTSDYVVAFAQPLDVRAIYLPYDQLRNPSSLEWVLSLARAGTINALVVDVKDEGGSALPIVANQTAIDMGAVRDTATDVQGFLDQLGDLGVYRIARVVTFLDGWLANGHPETAIRDFDGSIFRDGIDLAWTDPFHDLSRRHNIEIGVNAAAHFEEVQFDYVRLPTESMELRTRITQAQRSAIIGQFAAEAAQALHTVGAAISFDTFGLTTVVLHDDGIGQVLEEMAPFLDYYSPMVYPSTWTTGWFGVPYPPADPFTIVLESVAAATRRLQGYNIVVRPWLQDFHDYQAQKLFYGPHEVAVQIDASNLAGGSGFMLWDPSLGYEVGLLSDIATAGLPAALDATVPAQWPAPQ